jgi:hypothetical protein
VEFEVTVSSCEVGKFWRKRRIRVSVGLRSTKGQGVLIEETA